MTQSAKNAPSHTKGNDAIRAHSFMLRKLALALCHSILIFSNIGSAKGEPVKWEKDKEVTIDLNHQIRSPVLQLKQSIFSLTWNADGSKLAYFKDFGMTIGVLDEKSRSEKQIHRGCVSISMCSYSMAFIGSTDYLITNSSVKGDWIRADKTAQDAATNSLFSVYADNGYVALEAKNPKASRTGFFSVDPKGSFIATSFLPPYQKDIEVYNSQSRSIEKRIPIGEKGSQLNVGPISILKKGDRIAVALFSEAYIYNTKSWDLACKITPAFDLEDINTQISNIDFSPDGNSIVIGRVSGGKTLFLYKSHDCGLYQKIRIPDTLSTNSNNIIWPLLNTILYVDINGKCVSLDVSSGSNQVIFQPSDEARVASMAYSAASNRLAIASSQGITIYKQNLSVGR